MQWLSENWAQLLAFLLITPIVIWCLYDQAKMVEKINEQDRKENRR